MSQYSSEHTLNTVELLYSFKTDISQEIDLYLWNFDKPTPGYDFIKTEDYTSFFEGSHPITDPYYDSNYNVKAQFRAVGNNKYEFELEMLKLNYSWTESNNMTEVGLFTAIDGTQNKFTYNWTNIQGFLSGTHQTGDEVNITVELVDVDTSTSDFVQYMCLLDFEAPTIDITMGDGATDYSSANKAAPWTSFNFATADNMEETIDHDNYYYGQEITDQYQVKIFDNADNLVFNSGFTSLPENFETLFDLGIPVSNFENFEDYYYNVEIKSIDAAGNENISATYYTDISKLLVSNQVTLDFADASSTDVNSNSSWLSPQSIATADNNGGVDWSNSGKIDDQDNDYASSYLEVTQGGGGFQIETVKVTGVNQTAWQDVSFQNTYTDPVVLATLELPNGYDAYITSGDPTGTSVSARVRSVTSTGCQVTVKVPEYNYGDNVTCHGNIHLIVVEAGSWEESGWPKIEAGNHYTETVNSKSAWGSPDQITLNSTLWSGVSNARFFTTVVTENATATGTKWIESWTSNGGQSAPPTTSAFYLGMNSAECDDQDNHPGETISWVVIEDGSFTANGLHIKAGRTTDTIDEQIATNLYTHSFGEAPVWGIVKQVAMDGGDGGWSNWDDNPFTSTQIDPYCMEDNWDAENAHTLEENDYVIANETSFAYSAGGASTPSNTDWIRATNFGFNVPTGANITGIIVEMDKYATDTAEDSIRDDAIYLRKTSGQVGNDKGTTSWWADSDTDAYTSYGGTSDLWGTTWTAAEINSADFGVDIAAENIGSSNTAYIDHVRIKIYYTESIPIEEGNILNINKIYEGLGDLINFTIIGPDGSEMKNQSVNLKSGDYFISACFWNETTETYQVVFDSLNDLIIYSDNHLDYTKVYSNLEVDNKLTWVSEGDDHFAFAKHASLDDELVLTYYLREEMSAIMDAFDIDAFRMFDHLETIEAYYMAKDPITLEFDTKVTFTEGEDYVVNANGTLTWSEDVDFNELLSEGMENNEVYFTYYGSEYSSVLKDEYKNGVVLNVLIPNIYSTHCTIDAMEIVFMDLDSNSFSYSMGALDFDKYFKDASQYKKVIPGLGELLEIPIHVDLQKLVASNLEAELDFERMHSVSVVVKDADVWPGSFGDFDPDLNASYVVFNYPYQVFGLTEFRFYDILGNESSLGAYFEDLNFECVVGEGSLYVDKYEPQITDFEAWCNEANMLFSSLNHVYFSESIDVQFRLDGETDPYALHEIRDPMVGLYDDLTDTLIALSIVDWDDSIDKYRARFIVMEDILSGNTTDYEFKLCLFETATKKEVNSTQTIEVDLVPQLLSKLCLENDREIVFNDDYSFTLDTKFNLVFDDVLELKGFILDDSINYREREIIEYGEIDPIGGTGSSSYELDLHGLVGDSNFIDRDNFVLEYIDKEHDNEIFKLWEVIDGDIAYNDTRIESISIEYYDYYRVDYPNKFILKIDWNTDNLIGYDTKLLLSYKVMQGKAIFPVVFEDISEDLTSIDFRRFDYDNFTWVNAGKFEEILNIQPALENKTGLSVTQGQTTTIANSSIGSGIIDLISAYDSQLQLVNSTDYNYTIINENGIDALKVTYTGSDSINIIEYSYAPILRLVHPAAQEEINNSTIIVSNNYADEECLKLTLEHGTDYEIIGTNSNDLIFYTLNTSIQGNYSLESVFMVNYRGNFTQEVNLVETVIFEILDENGNWIPIEKISLDDFGEFDSSFYVGEGGLQLPVGVEMIGRIIYLPINLTGYDNQASAVNYAPYNSVYNTSQGINEMFTIHVEGKASKIHFIPDDFTNAFDRYAIVDRQYSTVTNDYESLHDGEQYTALDLHRTITDDYSFNFQLTDEFDDPLANQLVWLEIGIKPKAGLNFKEIGWVGEDQQFIDTEAPGTAFFMDEGMATCFGPGTQGIRSRMFNKPETWEYLDPETMQPGEYSSYVWDYQITDVHGLVEFDVEFDYEIIDHFSRIFDESIFSSGSVTQDSLDDYRLYTRVFHAPIFDGALDMALEDGEALLCSAGNNVYDNSRIDELEGFDFSETTYYAGSYGEGLLTLYQEDIMLGLPNLMVCQYGSDQNVTFTVQVAEADVIPSAEIKTIDKLRETYESTDLIPEGTITGIYETSEVVKDTPIWCVITDYYGENPFDTGGYPQMLYVNENGSATFEIKSSQLQQLIPGVYQVSVYTDPDFYTKQAYRFCTLEVRPENYMKYGEPTMTLDLNNWFDSGWGSAYNGSDYMYYEDVYPRLVGYLAPLHNESGLDDYVNFKVSAKIRDDASDEWSNWTALGEEDIYISSLPYDGLTYFEIALGQDGEMLMGKQVKLNITADCTYNQSGMEQFHRTQGLNVLDLKLVTSDVREDPITIWSYTDSDTTEPDVEIGCAEGENIYGIERYFTYDPENINDNIYGIDSDDVMMNINGYVENSVQIVEVRGLRQEYYDEITIDLDEYEIGFEDNEVYTIKLDDYDDILLINNSDLIIVYEVEIEADKVLTWNFPDEDNNYVRDYIINGEDYFVDLNHEDYLGTFYSIFNETQTTDEDGVTVLDIGIPNLKGDNFTIYNIIDSDGTPVGIEVDGINIYNNQQIEIDTDKTAETKIHVEYGISTYRLDRGYQQIGKFMNQSVRKISRLHDTNKLVNYSEGAVDVDLLAVADDPEDPIDAGAPKILVPICDANATKLTFEYLSLLYDSRLSGTFVLDETILNQDNFNTKPILVSFTITDQEDGESYFDYITINVSDVDKNGNYDFEISLQPIYAVKGYTIIDVSMEFVCLGDLPKTAQYVIIDKFEFTADDRILQTIANPPLDYKGDLRAKEVVSSPNYIQIFTPELNDTYGVLDDSWMTIAVEGFDGFGELVKLSKLGDELAFDTQGDEYYFQSLASCDRRLYDSLGFHLNSYDTELPQYLEGEINLYKGKGTHIDGEISVIDKEIAMNWEFDDYTVIRNWNGEDDYNNDNFNLSTTPLTSYDFYVEGELYTHHRIDLSTATLIHPDLDDVEFAYKIPNSTSRISSFDVAYIDRISSEWDWEESWQGYSLTQDDFNSLDYIYSDSSTELESYGPFGTILDANLYELYYNQSGHYQINFKDTESNVIGELGNLIQVDLHLNYEFVEGDYQIVENPNGWDSYLHWLFPDDAANQFGQFPYHPDLTSDSVFYASYNYLSEYAPADDFKGTTSEEFQYFPNQYNYTTFEFEGFTSSAYEVKVDLNNAGDFSNGGSHGLDAFVDAFSLLIQTESGEKFLTSDYIKNWDVVVGEDQNFSFSLDKVQLEKDGIEILEDSEILLTYYWAKESYSYTVSEDDIIIGGNIIVRNHNGLLIDTVGKIESVVGNTITFSEDISLPVGYAFTIEYEYKVKGGLLESKHVFVEVMPYEMQFYNTYSPVSGGSIIAPIYYNFSANYQYQMAVNYRLREKSALELEHVLNATEISADQAIIDMSDSKPFMDDSEAIVFVQYLNITTQSLDFINDEIHVSYNNDNSMLTVSELEVYNLAINDILFISVASRMDNKYSAFHDIEIDLLDNVVSFNNWTMDQQPEINLIPNFESTNFMYNVDPLVATSSGKVKQLYAILNETNTLTYYLTEDLDDPDNGWEDYDKLIMKMGFLNPDVLSYLNLSFYGADYINSTRLYLEDIEDDSGAVYITLPVDPDLSGFTVANNARIEITPMFYESTDYLGYFYTDGVPTTQVIEWDEELIENGLLGIDLEKDIVSTDQEVIVFNELFEKVYAISDIDIRMENFTTESGEKYSLEFNNISLPEWYLDLENSNNITMKDGDLLYLKYNATLEKSVGLTIEDMVLQKGEFMPNHVDNGATTVPRAEISLLGINTDGIDYNATRDIFDQREKLVAWETSLDITPFENDYYDSYMQKIINISFEDINSNFVVSDAQEETDYCYITDVLITSNDPRYEIVVDSFYIFEFDLNASIYDSEVFDAYPNNHIASIYYGNYGDLYDSQDAFYSMSADLSEGIPIYQNNASIDETEYIEIYDKYGNFYYAGEHLTLTETSPGVYNVIWNSDYSEEYYWNAQNPDQDEKDEQELEDLYEYYQPFIDRYNYLYFGWADNNSWSEWHTIDVPNVVPSSLDISFDYYNETIEEYQTISYNQTESEFEVVQFVIEEFYPYNLTTLDEYTFDLSQDYSNSDVEIESIEGYYFDESNLTFTIGDCTLDKINKKITIKTPSGEDLSSFESIMVILKFTDGAYSDYTKFKMNVKDNKWTKNDSIWVEFEYKDVDYFLIFEDSEVGSDDSMFEQFAYLRNDLFAGSGQDFTLTTGAQLPQFDNFTQVALPSQVIELYNYDQEGGSYSAVQMTDLSGDGIYDVYQYGTTDSSGELAYHKYLYKFENTENSVDKTSDVRLTDEYRTKKSSKVKAQRTITTNTEIDSTITTKSVMIQEDVDKDGAVDIEMTLEQAFETHQIMTITTEVTRIRDYGGEIGGDLDDEGFTPFDNTGTIYEEIFLTETINRTHSDSRSHYSLSFTDYMNGDVNTSRTYEDIFPNELVDAFKLDNYAQQVTDASGLTTVQAPDLNQLLAVSHSTDNVPVQLDSVTTITAETHDFTISNILATEETVTIPRGLSIVESLTSIDAMKVTPAGGVYYDNNPGGRKEKVIGGSYYYVDSDLDAAFDTIFITDDSGDVLGVGFDYNFDGYFEPNNEEEMEVHRLGGPDISDPTSYLARYKKDKTVYFDTEEDRRDGLHPEPVFSDSLFDLWKTQYSVREGALGSSVLLKQAAAEARATFRENTNPAKDFWNQVGAIFVGAVSGVALGLVTGGGMSSVGFMLGYGAISLSQQIAAKKKQDIMIASQMIHGPGYQGKHVLSKKSWIDSFWEGTMFESICGMQTSVYAPVRHQTDKHEYIGQLILAGMGQKYDAFTQKFIPSELDYSQQTRNYEKYSDFSDVYAMDLIKNFYGFTYWNANSKFAYAKNSLMVMEDSVAALSRVDEPLVDQLDRMIPTIAPVGDKKPYNTPIMDFASSNANVPLPEFYEDRPIYLSQSEYDDINPETQHHSIYKAFDSDSATIQLIPEESVHVLHSEVLKVNAYGLKPGNSGLKSTLIETLNPVEYSVDYSAGTITLSTSAHANLKARLEENGGKYEGIAFHVEIEKYRSVKDARNLVDPDTPLTEEQVQTIATMQAAQKSVLEYFYQDQIASSVGLSQSEMAYTVMLTIATTAFTSVFMLPIAIAGGISSQLSKASTKILAEEGLKITGKELIKKLGKQVMKSIVGKAIGHAVLRQVMSLGIEPLQEVLLDPIVETCVSNVVMMGTGNEYLAMFASTFSESGREALSGVTISPVINYLGNQIYAQLSNAYSFVSTVREAQSIKLDLDSSQTSVASQLIDAMKSRALMQSRSLEFLTKKYSPQGEILHGLFKTMQDTGVSPKTSFKESLKSTLWTPTGASDPAGIHASFSNPLASAIFGMVEGIKTLKEKIRSFKDNRKIEKYTIEKSLELAKSYPKYADLKDTGIIDLDALIRIIQGATKEVNTYIGRNENPMRITIEDSRTGKIFKLEVYGHHKLEKIVSIITENLGIIAAEQRGYSLVLNGMELNPALKVKDLVNSYGLQEGSKMALWARAVGGATLFDQLLNDITEDLSLSIKKLSEKLYGVKDHLSQIALSLSKNEKNLGKEMMQLLFKLDNLGDNDPNFRAEDLNKLKEEKIAVIYLYLTNKLYSGLSLELFNSFYEDVFLKSNNPSEKLMYLEILNGINKRMSDIDLDKILQGNPLYASYPSLNAHCIRLWGNTYRGLQLELSQITERTNGILRDRLRNTKDFNGDPINYDDIRNELIAVGDIQNSIGSVIKLNGITNTDYDMIYLLLGRQDSFGGTRPNHNLLHLLEGHFESNNLQSDFSKIGLKDPKAIAELIFKVVESQHGVEVDQRLHRVVYKLEYHGRVEYLVIGIDNDKSIHTAFLAGDILKEEYNRRSIYNILNTIDPYIV